MVTFSLTIIRHGETAANLKGIIQGQFDEPLNSTGRTQAKQLGVAFRSHKRPAFTHIFSSDLIRALETAQILLRNHIESANVDECIETTQLLRERCYGILEGHPASLLRLKAKEANIKTLEYVCEGGESLAQLYERGLSFFESLCDRLDCENSERENSRMPNSNGGRRSETQSSIGLPVWAEEETPGGAFMQTEEEELATASAPPSALSLQCECLDSGSMRIRSASARNTEFVQKETDAAASARSHKQSSLSLGSCSDDSFFPEIDAHVLVVSHGGLIRELLRLMCNINMHMGMSRTSAMRGSAPNTAVSRFMLNLDGKRVTSVTCLELHNNDHLSAEISEMPIGSSLFNS